jgi:hypothetical protein
LIDAGAAMVVGHHPHVAQSIEVYHDGLIAYSLGNFLFDQTLWPGLGLWVRADKHGVIDVRGLSMRPGIIPEWRRGDQSTNDFAGLCRVRPPEQ